MNILLFITYTLLILVVLKKTPFFKFSSIGFKWLATIFTAKLIVGFAYAYIHQHYYVDADAFTYVEKGALLQSYFFEDKVLFLKLCFGPNGFTAPENLKPYVQPLGYWTDVSAYALVRINALLSFIGFGNYYLHLIFWQFFGLLGLTALYKAFAAFFEDKKLLLIAGIFLLPSVLFWYSGIHKEAICICGIGFCTLFVVRWYQRQLSFSLILVTLISLILLALIRLYLIAIILPAAVALYSSLNNKKIYAKYIMAYGLSGILLALVVLMKPNLNPVNEFIVIQQYFEIAGAGNAEIKIPKLEPSLWSLVKNSPRAFFSTLFKPSLLDVSPRNTAMKIFAGSETLLICLLIISSLIWGKWTTYLKHPIVIYILCIVVLYFVLLGLTIPNLGALHRYKSMVLPLLMPVLLLVFDVRVFFKSVFFRKANKTKSNLH